jgi:hypothetical protein
MRRSSSTWRFSLWLLLALPLPAAARPFPCLPPVFEGGKRIHDQPVPSVQWLELLLRQHELCWRRPARAGEVRVALFGNSSIFGFPLPVEQTFGHLLNQRFVARDVPAHLFNLASLYTYELRDAVVMHRAMPYAPDLLLYPLTFADLIHSIPAPGPGSFLEANLDTLQAFADDPPAGIAEPVEMYRDLIERERHRAWRLRQLRSLGALARLGARHQAESLVRRLGSTPAPGPALFTFGRQTKYDCQETQDQYVQQFTDWQSWNILAYLEQLRRQHGVEVVVVAWPLAHEPVGDCYNVRFPNGAVAEFRSWLRDETRARGLTLVDLLELLPAEDFIDSLHVGKAGHARIAERLGEALEPKLRALYARRSGAAE